ncbi:hypothetical protein LCGC14_0758140 [marine sediment metagenome]|uniref:Uncharacterized protein n=1 Tax=marine sediment metagenome TaxID=412755 RepID=A0A0F9QLU4_9ZZZZ
MSLIEKCPKCDGAFVTEEESKLLKDKQAIQWFKNFKWSRLNKMGGYTNGLIDWIPASDVERSCFVCGFETRAV